MTLELFGHIECSLCDRLESMIRRYHPTVHIIKRDIRDNPEWLTLYRERIPVVTHNGRIILEGRPSEDEVSKAMISLGG
ncbi:MAG: hypothetical protein GC164_07660 [Phycisphaera sp.]|nr:hypothetical protein [Phycisphaera sp.]